MGRLAMSLYTEGVGGSAGRCRRTLKGRVGRLAMSYIEGAGGSAGDVVVH